MHLAVRPRDADAAVSDGGLLMSRDRSEASHGTRDLGVVTVWLRAIAHPVRLRALIVLRDGPRTVQALSHALGVEQKALMRHLRALARLAIIRLQLHGSVETVSLSAAFVVLDFIDCIVRDPRAWK